MIENGFYWIRSRTPGAHDVRGTARAGQRRQKEDAPPAAPAPPPAAAAAGHRRGRLSGRQW